jgi:coenzyme F420-reducing hydrogenase gamma subunit
MNKKLRVGWFSFSCCEDSTILFTELMNDHYEEWLKLVDFKASRILKSKNDETDLDVAFVEGAIASKKDEKKLKKLRKNSKKLIAIGSCAVTGMPSAQRNEFDAEKTKEIAFLVKRFKLAKKVVPLSKIVKVDASVSGCPMDEKVFLKLFNDLLIEFGAKNA